MPEECEGCKSCHVDIETLEEFEEANVDFPQIASYLGGTISKVEDGHYLIHLGKENAGIHIRGRGDKEFVFVVVMRSKKLFVSNHIIYGVEKVKFSTVLAPRGKTKCELRDIVLQNEQGGIIIGKERNKYTVVTFIGAKEKTEEKIQKGGKGGLSMEIN